MYVLWPVLAAGLLVGAVRPSAAQTVDVEGLRREIEQLRKELETVQQQYGERLAALEARLGAAQGAPAAAPAPQAPQTAEVPPGAPGGGAPAGQLPAYGVATAGSKIFNPDIGIIGNFLGSSGRDRGGSGTVAPTPFMTLQESEASFQAIVDPYARADFFLAIGEEGIEVEEGFATFPALPGGLLVKAGKMRANFGRLNAFHNHTLPWIDRPLVMYNLLGGSVEDPDTGIKDAGVSVSRLIPAGSVFLEATGELYRGDSGTLFKSSRRRDVAALGRVRGYVDLTDQTNVEAGASYTRGHNDLGSDFVTELYGADLTLRWRPLGRAIYRSLAARTELVWSRREEVSAFERAFGLYGSLDYQFARRWFAGGRYDQAERGANASIRDRGFSTVVTYWPSEFSQLRSQYRRTRYGDGDRVANELLFQLLFTIGTHGAHPF
ncbi:MAG: hypothetical protein A3G77_17415 [Acidobacteria bacterium RIFCSPLOWO2_12_FULL_68_19]|nr:MAG: hypothetical protein A3G77_17415 [Acidobacteria bacterium RIFCSPLOWO2_12_FULL_68_19]